jgi:hypothetical protein
MTTAIKRRRGTTVQHSTFTGLEGELTVDTTKKTVVVHDGSTAGGIPLAKEGNPTFTGQTSVGAGTVTAPSITTTGDTNTGIYFPAADTIAFTEGGAEAMRIDSSGNVGIGTNSPSSRLHVFNSTTAIANIQTTGSGSYAQLNLTHPSNTVELVNRGDISQMLIDSSAWTMGIRTMSAQPLYFATNATERMRIDSSGNLGIGTSSPGAKLHIQGVSTTGSVTSISNFSGLRIDGSQGNTSVTGITFQDGGGGGAAIGFARGGSFDTNIRFYTNPVGTTTAGAMTERLRIDPSGNILIGKTTATANGGDLQVSSGITFPATQVPKSDANTLDDYEEGTWTPVYQTSNNDASLTMSTASARYTKIGRQVILQAYMFTSAVSSVGTGDVRITGLPFTSAFRGTAEIAFARRWNSNVPISGNIPSGLNYIALISVNRVTGYPADLTNTVAADLSTVADNMNIISLTAVYTV